MEVFRIVSEKNSTKLAASGNANRWNLDAEFVMYAGSSRSLATLELIVNRKSIQPNINYKVMIISIADEDDLFSQVKTKDLPDNWRIPESYSDLQEIGSNWYRNRKSLVLKVPSAVIPSEFNYVINIAHEDFDKKIKLVRIEDYFWDKRIF